MKTEEPIRIRSQAEARWLIESRDIPYVKLGVTDIDGVLRGKYLGREKFFPLSRRVSASATWSLAGTATISSTTT